MAAALVEHDTLLMVKAVLLSLAATRVGHKHRKIDQTFIILVAIEWSR
jgi:hypothetical protein